MNNFTGIGRVGGDPTVRYTNDDKAVASFSVAIDSGFGQKKATHWFKVTLFDKRATVANYIKKGHLVGVSGELSMSKWTDKSGIEQTTLELNNPNITLIGRVSKDEEAADSFSTPRQPRPAPTSAPQHDDSPFGDDVPF